MLKKMGSASGTSALPQPSTVPDSQSIASDRGFPRIVTAPAPSVDLVSWLETNQDGIRAELLRAGGTLFRGFDIHGVAAFQQALQTLYGALVEYTVRSTPRSVVKDRVYTSTDYPASESIPQHNEMSYTRTWPMKIAFHCLEPAASGGETPISDSRRVYQAVPAAVRERLATRGVLYVRNYLPRIDLPWQEVFQTHERDEVERLCAATGIECRWRGDRLTTRQRCQGVATHPDTGEAVWFNQAHLFHVSSLPPARRATLLRELGREGLPRHACYGDGGDIPDDDLEAVRRAYDAETIVWAWRPGDFLLLDNMLAAHGRMPFSGRRQVVVAMAQPRDAPELGVTV